MESEDQIILLVEDDPIDRHLFEMALKQLSLKQVLVVKENGEQAFEYLKTTSDQVFLVLCDINMPKMNGKELKEQIEMDKFLRYKAIPFVYLTTSQFQKDVNDAYDLSAQAFFTKPARFEESVSLIASIVNYWNKASHPRSI